jgi:hypothetical protein
MPIARWDMKEALQSSEHERDTWKPRCVAAEELWMNVFEKASGARRRNTPPFRVLDRAPGALGASSGCSPAGPASKAASEWLVGSCCARCPVVVPAIVGPQVDLDDSDVATAAPPVGCPGRRLSSWTRTTWIDATAGSSDPPHQRPAPLRPAGGVARCLPTKSRFRRPGLRQPPACVRS